MKKAYFLLFLILVSSIFACKKDDPNSFDNLDLLAKIQSLEGVEAIEISPEYGYPRVFQIDITQPVDHNNPDGVKFTQRIYLSHEDESMPMIFAPSGYTTSTKSGQEIAGIMGTNCLNVTHRYFTDAKPSPLDWQYLTIEQAAADHHRIVELFKKIYKNKWVSSGASKSGQAVLFHKRYYPDDVDATIAYVAPFVFGPKDMVFANYIENIGESDCYTRLTNLQRMILENRTEALQLVDQYITADGQTYSLGHGFILELAIMDYPFLFWQYYDYNCSQIPDETNTLEEIFNHFTSVVPLNSFSDATIAHYEPYVYQTLTETGAPGYKTDYLSDLLQNIDASAIGNPNFELLAPTGVSYTFNQNTLTDIYNWLQNQGNNIIYIYGVDDPWTAGAIELTGATNAIKIVQPGTNHRVKIADLDNPNQVYSALEDWLGVDIQTSTKKMNIEFEDGSFGYRLEQ